MYQINAINTKYTKTDCKNWQTSNLLRWNSVIYVCTQLCHGNS